MLYNIKVYTYDWVYKDTISPALIKNELSFDWNINGWQWTLTLNLNLPIDNNDYSIGDMLRIYSYPTQNKAGILLYTGGVKDITREATQTGEEITLNCQWFTRLFVRKLFRWPLNELTWTINEDPWNIIKQIIDQINAQFVWWRVSYSDWLVQNYGTNIELQFENTSCFDALETIQEITQRDFFIRADGQFIFRPTPTTPTHILTYKYDVDSLNVKETSIELVNRLILEWDWVTGIYNDPTSQTDYGLFEFSESDNKIPLQATVDLAAENIVNERKNPKREISIEVNNQYDFTTINPWDTVAVTNINYSIQNAKVISVSYRNGRMELSLDRYIWLWKQILSLVNGN